MRRSISQPFTFLNMPSPALTKKESKCVSKALSTALPGIIKDAAEEKDRPLSVMKNADKGEIMAYPTNLQAMAAVLSSKLTYKLRLMNERTIAFIPNLTSIDPTEEEFTAASNDAKNAVRLVYNPKSEFLITISSPTSSDCFDAKRLNLACFLFREAFTLDMATLNTHTPHNPPTPPPTPELKPQPDQKENKPCPKLPISAC